MERAKWGTSDKNRKVKFYSITKAGQKQLAQDAAYWQWLTGVMGRVLEREGGASEAFSARSVQPGAFLFPQ